MSSSSGRLFQEVHKQVRDVVDRFMEENNPENASEFSGLLELTKRNFEDKISALPERHQATFFDEVVSRVVLQKAADVAAPRSNEQCALLKLTLTMLYGPKVLKPSGLISLVPLIDEATAKITAVGTRLVTWFAEKGPLDDRVRHDFRVYEKLGCFMAGLYAELQDSPFWEHADDHRAIGLFGLDLISNVIYVDQAQILFLPMRCYLFRVVFTWLAESEGFFFQELMRREDLLQMYYWLDRFEHFLRIRAIVLGDPAKAAAIGEPFFHDPEHEFKVHEEIQRFRDAGLQLVIPDTTSSPIGPNICFWPPGPNN